MKAFLSEKDGADLTWLMLRKTVEPTESSRKLLTLWRDCDDCFQDQDWTSLGTWFQILMEYRSSLFFICVFFRFFLDFLQLRKGWINFHKMAVNTAY